MPARAARNSVLATPSQYQHISEDQGSCRIAGSTTATNARAACWVAEAKHWPIG